VELEPWKNVFRNVIAPALTREELETLYNGLARADSAILQGGVCLPAPYHVNMRKRLTACDPILYGPWKCGRIKNVEDALQLTDSVSIEADMTIGVPGALNLFFEWWDKTPREAAVNALAAEVSLMVADRKGVVVA